LTPHSRIAQLIGGLMISAEALAQATPAPSESRGALLYSTHCIACHTSQIHWRDKKLATDWTSLKAQVSRWQANAQLGWSEHDIVEVARHLNVHYYGFPQTGDQVSRLGSRR
jgi:mono/diheme cytochrome c family protein